METRIYHIIYDMDTTQDYPTVEDIRQELKTESGRAHILHTLLDLSLTGDTEAQAAMYDLIGIMEGMI